MLDLWLVRHGESKWNAQKRTQGQHPSPKNDLTELGKQQAKALKQRLELESFDLIYSSDLPRAIQTVKICFSDAEIIQDERLREIKRAGLAGKTHEERTTEERALLAFIKQDRYANRPPNGENHQDVMDRVQDWMAGLPQKGSVLVITHGGVIRAVIAQLIRYENARFFDLVNTGITRLNLSDEKTRIICVNDYAHLNKSL